MDKRLKLLENKNMRKRKRLVTSLEEESVTSFERQANSSDYSQDSEDEIRSSV